MRGQELVQAVQPVVIDHAVDAAAVQRIEVVDRQPG
jgi:hypothetical protein